MDNPSIRGHAIVRFSILGIPIGILGLRGVRPHFTMRITYGSSAHLVEQLA